MDAGTGISDNKESKDNKTTHCKWKWYFLRIPNIGFTYHVGEEFRHIMSGLRHISEVMEHFNYKAGDRLGHAIALGVDVDQWVRENEVITIPAMEHLENLLWLWGSIVQK